MTSQTIIIEMFLSIHRRLDTVSARITELHEAVNAIKKKEQKMSAQLDVLTAQVAENTEVEESAIALIEGIAAKLAAAQDDPAAVAALVDQLNASADALAAAVAANTIAE
jgi:chromosome segregation ATPase